MNYEALYKKCTPYFNLPNGHDMLIAYRDCIEIKSRWQLRPQKSTADYGRAFSRYTSPFTIYPDGTVQIHYDDVSSIKILAEMGLACDIQAGKTVKAHKVYRHKLLDDYVFTPGMQVSLLDGTPLDAKRLDKINTNATRLKDFRTKFAKFRTVFLTYGRLNIDGSGKASHRNNVGFRSYISNKEFVAQVLSNAIRSVGTPAFSKHVETLEKECGWDWHTDPKENKAAFLRATAALRKHLYAEFDLFC